MKVIITPQKALELLTDYALKRRVDHSDKYIIKAYSNTIKEAISKETPLKPTNQVVIDFGLGNAGNCKACNREVNYQNKYCDNCGWKIDWREEA